MYSELISSLLEIDTVPDWGIVSVVDVNLPSDKPPTCSICLQEGNQITVPRISQCGHYFCYACVARYLLRDDKTGLIADKYCPRAGAPNTSTGASPLNGPYLINGTQKPPSRKCPVCKLELAMTDLRPVRFQSSERRKMVRKFALVKVDPSVCGGITIPSHVERFSTGSELPHLPACIPRESHDVGWHFSKIALVSDASVEDMRVNDAMGLIQQAWHIRKNPDGIAGDTEMLPFLDVIIAQELVQNQCATKEEFIRKHQLPTTSTLRAGSSGATKQPQGKIYDEVAYDRKKNTVQIDLEAELGALTPIVGKASGSSAVPAGSAPGDTPSRDGSGGQRTSESPVQEDRGHLQDSQVVTPKTSDVKGSPQLDRKASEDEWHAVRKESDDTTGAPSVGGTSCPSKSPIWKPPPSHRHSSTAYYMYQSWDAQPVFIAPFFMKVLEYEYGERLPALLDLAEPPGGPPPGSTSKKSSGNNPFNSRYYYQDSLTVTEEQRRSMALMKRIAVYQEIDLVEFDVFPFISAPTKAKFKQDFDKRRRQHQQEDARRKWDEDWVAEKAKDADEKYLKELQERSWMNVQPVNTSVPKAEEDFKISLEVSRLIADHEHKTKKKITDEELAVLLSLEEERKEEERRLREEERQREQKAAEEEERRRAEQKKAAAKKSTSARGNMVVDAWDSDDGGDPASALCKLGFTSGSAASSNRNVKNAWGAASSSAGNVDTPEASNKQSRTGAERLKMQKQQEEERKKKEEADKSYFPSLADTTAGLMTMSKKTKKKNVSQVREAVFGTTNNATAEEAAVPEKSPQEEEKQIASSSDAPGSSSSQQNDTAEAATAEAATGEAATAELQKPASADKSGDDADFSPYLGTADEATKAAGGKGRKKKAQKIRLFG